MAHNKRLKPSRKSKTTMQQLGLLSNVSSLNTQGIMCHTFIFYGSYINEIFFPNMFGGWFRCNKGDLDATKLLIIWLDYDKGFTFFCVDTTTVSIHKSIHIGGAIFLAIWHHKELLYLFYIFTLQNIQHQWFYFNFQHNKIIYLLQ